MVQNAVVVVLCTIPPERARSLADLLLAGRLAACVNLLGPMHSRYWWEGRIEQSEEILLLIKTRKDLLQELTVMIRDHHGYQVPEVLSFEASFGLPAYLEWVSLACRPPSTSGAGDSSTP